MAQNISTNNVGKVLPVLFMTLLEKMDIFDTSLGGGLASQNVGFNRSLFLPQFDLSGDTVIPWTADSVPTIVASQTATTGESPTDIDYSEKELVTTDLTFAIGDIIPNSWREVWEPLAPDPNAPFNEIMLNPKVQTALLTRMIQYASKYDSTGVWQFDTASGDPYDGLIKRITSSSNTVNLFETGDTAISASTIVTYLSRLYAEARKNKTFKSHPNLKFIMSEVNLGYYEDAEIATSGKGPLNSQLAQVDNFRKIPIYTSQGMPDDVIILTYASSDKFNSTLHVGMKNAQDNSNPEIGPYADGARKWWARMDYSMGTQITNDSDIKYIQIA